MQTGIRRGIHLSFFRSVLFSTALFWNAHAGSWKTLNGPSRFDSGLPPAITGMKLVGERLFAMADSGLFVTVDEGASWLRSDAGLPKSIVLDIQTGDSLLFARTKSGIYASPDGKQWSGMGGGISKFHDMAPAGRDLYVAGDSTVYHVRIRNGGWEVDSIGSRTGLQSLLYLKGWLIVNSSLPASPYIAWRTNDDGQSWQTLNSPMDGRSFEIRSDGLHLYSSVGVNRGPGETSWYFFSSPDFGQSWHRFRRGADTTFATYTSFMNEYFLGWKVLDSAMFIGSIQIVLLPDPHTDFLITPDEGNSTFTRNSINGFIAGKREKLFMVQPSEKKLLESTDLGKDWNQKNTTQPVLDPVLSLAAGDTEICLSTPYYYGRIKCSHDGGGTWSEYGLNASQWAVAVGDGRGKVYRASLRSGLKIDGFSVGFFEMGVGEVPIFGVARSDSEIWAGFSGSTIVHQVIGRPYSHPWEYYMKSGLPNSDGYSLCFYQNRILLGMVSGVYRLNNGDTTWKPANPISPSTVVSLATDGKRLFGVINGRLNTSPDAGATWEAVESQPGGVLNCIAAKNDTLYAGTNAGLWTTAIAAFPIPNRIIGSAKNPGKPSIIPRLIWVSHGPMGVLLAGDERVFGMDGKIRKTQAPIKDR